MEVGGRKTRGVLRSWILHRNATYRLPGSHYLDFGQLQVVGAIQLDAQIPPIPVEVDHRFRSGRAPVAVGGDIGIRLSERKLGDMHGEISQPGAGVVPPVENPHRIQSMDIPQIHLPPGVGFGLGDHAGSRVVVRIGQAINGTV